MTTAIYLLTAAAFAVAIYGIREAWLEAKRQATIIHRAKLSKQRGEAERKHRERTKTIDAPLKAATNKMLRMGW